MLMAVFRKFSTLILFLVSRNFNFENSRNFTTSQKVFLLYKQIYAERILQSARFNLSDHQLIFHEICQINKSVDCSIKCTLFLKQLCKNN